MDSSMTLLRGEFALILMASLPDNVSVSDLEKQLAHIESKLGLRLHVRELSEQELQPSSEPQGLFIISVYGADKPGIVSGVSLKLAELGYNITDVQTHSTGTADKPVFVMILEVVASASATAQWLREQLLTFTKHLNVDITVQSLEVAEL